MSNGYKPAPLDLSDVKLLPPQEILVDKLAENAHNVWAKDRIKQGWTYGIQQVRSTRSSLLEKLGDVIIHQNAILLWWVLDWKMEVALALYPSCFNAFVIYRIMGLGRICNGHTDINSRHNSNFAEKNRLTFSLLIWFTCNCVPCVRAPWLHLPSFPVFLFAWWRAEFSCHSPRPR